MQLFELKPNKFKRVLCSVIAMTLLLLWVCPNLDVFFNSLKIDDFLRENSRHQTHNPYGRHSTELSGADKLVSCLWFVGSIAFVMLMPRSLFVVYWLSACFAGYYCLLTVVSVSVKDFILLLLLILAAVFCRLCLKGASKVIFELFQKFADLYEKWSAMFPRKWHGRVSFDDSSTSAIMVLASMFLPIIFFASGTTVQKIMLLLPILHLVAWPKYEPLTYEKSGEIITTASSIKDKKMSGILEFVRADLDDSLKRIQILCPAMIRSQKEIRKEELQTRTPRIQNAYQVRESLKSLNKLKQRDANFNENVFLERAKAAFIKFQDAYYNQDIDSVQHFLSDGLYERVKAIIEEKVHNGIKYEHGDFENISMTIDHFFSDENFDEIQVLVRGHTTQRLVNTETTNMVDFCEFWSFIRRPSAKTIKKPGLIEGNCPNCGNPLKMGQTTVCPICNSFIRSGCYDWVLCNITQYYEWAYTDPKSIPGWVELKQQDPLFNVYQIEDLAGVFFVKMRLAERLKQAELVYRFVKSSLFEEIERKMQNDKNAISYKNIEIASIKLKAISFWPETIKLYTLIIWSGVPEKVSGAKSILNMGAKPKPKVFRHVVAFCRSNKQKTGQNNTLSSAHCPNCGGNLKSSYAAKCTYCGSSLIDDREWHAEDILTEHSPEYLDVMKKKREIVTEHLKESDRLAKKQAAFAVISALKRVIMADNVVDEAEKKLISSIAKQFKQTEKDVLEMLKAAQGVSKADAKLLQSLGKRDVLKQAVQLALADGVLTDEEQDALNELCTNLNLSELNLNQFIKKEQLALEKAERQQKLEDELLSGRDVVAIMSRVMLADNKINEAEKKVLFGIAKKYHMNNTTLNEIVRAVKNNEYPAPKLESIAQKQVFLKSAVKMAYADGVLEPQEEELLKSIAAEVGYTAIDLNQMLKKAKAEASL